MLYQYVDQQQKSGKDESLHITYLVSGIMSLGEQPDMLKVRV